LDFDESDNHAGGRCAQRGGKVMDRGTVVGLAATLGLVVWVMFAGAGWAAHVFWRTPSLALVVGGAVLTTVVAFPGARLRSIGQVLKNALYVRTRPPEESIITLVALAEIARREGLLSLERPVESIRDDFLKRAMHMAIDGYEAATIRSVMQRELESIDLRHTQGKGLLESMGRSAPVFGMIGTLVGLVVMLGRLDDPTRIGPGMAVALLTTLYGLVVANVFCLPLARRLSQRSSEELLSKTIALEGVLAIQAGDLPRVVAQKLRAYVPVSRWPSELPRSVSEHLMSAGHENQADHAEDEAETAAEVGRRFVDAA